MVAKSHQISHRRTRAVRLPELCALVGSSRATIRRRVKDDPTFPKPFHLSPRITAWDEGEILDYLEAKKAEREVR